MLNGSETILVIASGGTITMATLLSSVNQLFFDYPINEAIKYPCIHHQWLPDYVEYESNFSMDYLDALKDRHHNLKEVVSLVVVQRITQALSGNEIFAHLDSCKRSTTDAVWRLI